MKRATGLIIGDAIKFARADVLKAIADAKVMGVVHSDLKPEEAPPQVLYDDAYRAYIEGAITCLINLLKETK